MKQGINLFRLSNSLWSGLLDSNPQLFRELQGRLKTRNVIISAAISVIAQFISVVFLLGKLPDLEQKFRQCSRYGTTLIYNQFDTGGQICYVRDDLGHWMVNWQLWWLDLFTILSFVSIAALPIVGTYMLIADMEREEHRGTLNFIRLTPQSASSILLGKILGVPILLYTAIALIFPLHLVAGLQAHIPLVWILAFDLAIATCCAFFYSLALLWSLFNIGVSGCKSWLASGLLGFVLLFSTIILFTTHSTLDHFLAVILLFNPGTVIAYLIEASHLSFGTTYFLSIDDLATLSFYGQSLWANTITGFGFILFNFCLWTYWCWSILKRRFQSPESNLISKVHSYYLTCCFVVIALGFTLQQDYLYENEFYDLANKFSPFQRHINDNFICLQISLSLFGLGLIYALTPHRQTLHDWARHRHQTSKNSSIWKELVFDENSPAIVSIAIDLAIAIIFITPSMLFILEPNQRFLFWGLIISTTNILLCAAIVQFILMSKTRSRGVWSLATIASVIILPALGLGIAGISIKSAPSLWLFSFIGASATEYASGSAIAFSIFVQWLAISVIGIQMTKKLKQAGASETKVLMGRTNALID